MAMLPKVLSMTFLAIISIFASRSRRRRFKKQFGSLLHFGKLKSSPIFFQNIAYALAAMITAFTSAAMAVNIYDGFAAIAAFFGFSIIVIFNAFDLKANWRKVLVYEYGVLIAGIEYSYYQIKDYYEDENGNSIIRVGRRRIEFSVWNLDDTDSVSMGMPARNRAIDIFRSWHPEDSSTIGVDCSNAELPQEYRNLP